VDHHVAAVERGHLALGKRPDMEIGELERKRQITDSRGENEDLNWVVEA